MKRQSTKRRGASAVEFALVAPVVLIFVLGLLEWSRFEMVRQVSASATFNAVREGTLPGATTTDMETRAAEILEVYFVKDAVTTATLTENEATLQVEIPMSSNSFVLGKFFSEMTVEKTFTLARPQ